MPNWKQIVGKNCGLGICSPELTEELAGHLEDSHEAALREGVSTQVAFQHTIGQIEGRCGLRLAMGFLQEEFMAGFITKIVLPGLVTVVAARFLYWVLALDHRSPEVIWLVGGQLPTWWWCLLPLCGAVGAFLSQRYGESRLQRIVVSLLPSAILCALVLMIFIVGFTMSGFVNHYLLASAHLESLGLVPPGFGIIPAAFSLLGAGIAEIGSKKSRLGAGN